MLQGGGLHAWVAALQQSAYNRIKIA